MSFGYSVLGFGSSATHGTSTAAPTGVSIRNTNADGRGYVNGADCFESSSFVSIVLLHGAPVPATLIGSGGGATIQLKMESSYSGGDAPTSWAWTTTFSNLAGTIVTGTTNLTSTSQNYDTFTFTINGSLSSGWITAFTVNLVSTNSGGSGSSSQLDMAILVP